jgi:hypothetical protein
MMVPLKRWAMMTMGILVFARVTFAREQDEAKKQENRIANSAVVMGEILTSYFKTLRKTIMKQAM